MAWYRSTTNTTGITTFDTPANALSVLNTFFTNCQAEGASFLWEIASYQSTSPRYLVLKRKDASAGRLMFFGGDLPNAVQLGPSVSANTTTLYVGYDRLATTDTPTNAYTGATRVWGGSAVNWMLGRSFGALSASASQLRAYCNSSNDTLAMFWTDNAANVFRGFTIVGDWMRNEAGTACEAFVTIGNTTLTGLVPIEPLTSGVSFTSTANAVQFTSVYDATLGDVVRVACPTPPINITPPSQSIQNERFLSLNGYAKFVPMTTVVVQGGPVPENRFYSATFMGIGPMKTLNFQWVDNAAAPKGYYIGYVGTTADVSGFSLIDSTF